MATSRPKQLLTTSGSRLAGLVQQAEALDRLTRAIRRELPASLSPHCRGTAFRKTSVIIFVDSPIWTARVRFYQNHLKTALKQQFKMDVRYVKVKVLPRKSSARPNHSEPRPLSATAKQLLQEAANGIDDSELADTLRRLGRSR